jgi:hypothetical protein
VGAVGDVVGEIWVREGRGSKRDPGLSPPSGCDPVICPPSTGNPDLRPPSTGDPGLHPPSTCDPDLGPPSKGDPDLRPPSTCDPALQRAASGEWPLEHTSMTLLQHACKLYLATQGTQTSTPSLQLGPSLHHRPRWRRPSWG